MVMKIIITERQFDLINENKGCEYDFKKKLNKLWLKTMFQSVIDTILKPHREKWKGDRDEYVRILKLIGFDDSKIDNVLDIDFVYNPDGSWSRINKLNTNYSDLSVLITDILLDENADLCKLSDYLDNNDKSFLIDLKQRMISDPEYYFDNYLFKNESKYVENNTKNTLLGDQTENRVVEFLVDKLKWELIYQSVEGSPIDTKLGIDLIMRSNYGDVKRIQVKSVGGISVVDETPCETSNDTDFKHKKYKGGFYVYARNGVSINPNNIDYVAYVDKHNIIICKKYMPVTVIGNNCIDEPIRDFPSSRRGPFFVDHESVVFKNIFIKPKPIKD